MTVCIVDTSVLCELLSVPGKSQDSAGARKGLEDKVHARERMLLPLPVILEAGNHIAQAAVAGQVRRTCAERFIAFVKRALAGESPFVTTPFPSRLDLEPLLDAFPGHAMREVGLVDATVIALWEAQCEIAPHRRVYIWSKDKHLQGFDRGP